MKSLRYFVSLVVMLFSVGCASTTEVITFPLKGTNTAVVRIMLDQRGMPSVAEETVVIKSGQRVVWVGPKEFSIIFPEGSPFEQDEFRTDDAVIKAEVPRNSDKRILKGEKKIKFKYDIRVGDMVLDPHVIFIET